MVVFVGAGPGAMDLITVRGKEKLEEADIIIYAGSLVNPDLLKYAKKSAQIYDSSSMTLEEVISIMEKGEQEGKNTLRLHSGDPSIFGAVREQIDILDKKHIPFSIVPGVSSFQAAAASLHAEFTLPNVSQTLILTRMEGRTKVPKKEEISLLASHQASMVIFLSASMMGQLSKRLKEGGYSGDTPVAIIYKASWPDEKMIHTSVSGMESAAKAEGIFKTALIFVGDFLNGEYKRSRLYDPGFSHGFRKATK